MNLKEIPRVEQLLPSPNELTYGTFAQQPEYVKVNRDLVEIFSHHLPSVFTHVDIATGTGLAPKLIIEEAQKTNRKGKIIGIDPNADSLEIARRTTPSTPDVSVDFIEGYGQNLEQLLAGKIPPDGVDAATIYDAIHEIPGEENKKQVLLSMAKVLKPNGVLSLNSAFTTFGMEPSPMAWGRWKANAFRPFGGRKDKEATAIEIHTPEQYRKMIEDMGLVVIHESKKIVNLTHEALVAISRYPRFIEGVFGDMVDQGKISPREKSDALIKALEGVKSIPRGWYEIIAIKPSTATASIA